MQTQLIMIPYLTWHALASVIHHLPTMKQTDAQLMQQKWSYEVKNGLGSKQSLNKTKNKVQLDVPVHFHYLNQHQRTDH